MDDDDKIRRNLVMLSFSVLLYFWFDLPEKVVSNRIFGSEAQVVLSSWKVWLVIVLALAYQAARYAGSLSNQETHKDAKNDFLVKVISVYRTVMLGDVKRFLSSKPMRYTALNVPDVLGHIAGGGPPTKEEFENFPWIHVRFAHEHGGTRIIEGSLAARKDTTMVNGPRIWADRRINRSLWIELRIWLRLVPTRHFVEIGIPVATWYVALLLALSRFGSALVLAP